MSLRLWYEYLTAELVGSEGGGRGELTVGDLEYYFMLAKDVDEGVRGEVERARGARGLAEEWMGARGGRGEGGGGGGVRICRNLIQARMR